MRSNRDILKGVAPKLLITLVFVICIWIFNLSFFEVGTLILLYTVASNRKGNYIRAGISVAILLLLIYGVTYSSGLNPVASFLLVGVLIAFFILYTRRKELLGAMQHIEKKHFGETMEEKKMRLNK